MRAPFLALFALLLALAPAQAAREFEHAQGRAQLDLEQTLRDSFPTPHVDWGAPLARPVRALFVIHVTTGTNAREVVELGQRFNLQADVVFEKDGVIYGDQAGKLRLRDLLRRRYDVFVLGQVPLELLGYEQQYELLKQVVAGAGLVCIGPRPAAVMTPERRLGPASRLLGAGSGLAALLPGDSSARLVDRVATAYRIKAGRGLHLDYAPLVPVGAGALTPQLPFSWENLARYEYWSAFTGRAMLWAAGHPLASPAALPLEGAAVPAATPQRVLAALVPAGRWLGALTRLDDGARVPVVLDSGGRELWAELPALRVGEYMLELRARDGERAAGFALVPFRAQGECLVRALQLDREFLEPGESLQAVVELAGPLLPGDLVRLRARDSYGREVWREDRPAGPQVRFSFTAGPECSLLLTLEAAWLRGSRELACARQELKVTHRNRGGFALVMWDAPTDVLGYWAVQRMTQAGFNVNLRGGEPPATVAAWGWAQIPYTTRLLDEYDAAGRMQPVCWNDEPAIGAVVAKTAQAYLPSRRHGVYVYSLGDETTTLGASTDPADLAAYREWLGGQYGDIAALNRSWRSSYRSFAEVGLLETNHTGRELALEQQALDQGLTARWFDRQAFARENYLRLCERYGREYARMDPQALTGFEGAGGFADDIGGIVARMGFWNPYPGTADAVLRSLAPPGYPRSNWIGYAHGVPAIVGESMRLVANGCNALFWWRWENIGLFMGYLQPDLDFFATTRVLSQEMAPLRYGVGSWMAGAVRSHDGIAVYHSLAAALAPRALPGTFEEQCELGTAGGAGRPGGAVQLPDGAAGAGRRLGARGVPGNPPAPDPCPAPAGGPGPRCLRPPRRDGTRGHPPRPLRSPPGAPGPAPGRPVRGRRRGAAAGGLAGLRPTPRGRAGQALRPGGRRPARGAGRGAGPGRGGLPRAPGAGGRGAGAAPSGAGALGPGGHRAPGCLPLPPGFQ